MKSLKSVISENPEYSTLIKAVIKGIGGMESVQDVNNNGIESFSEFIYRSDNYKFVMKYRKQIIALLEKNAECDDIDVFELVLTFFEYMDYEDKKELGQYLTTGKNTQSELTDMISWNIGETVCRMFED